MKEKKGGRGKQNIGEEGANKQTIIGRGGARTPWHPYSFSGHCIPLIAPLQPPNALLSPHRPLTATAGTAVPLSPPYSHRWHCKHCSPLTAPL